MSEGDAHFHGHRERLRHKLLEGRPDSLADYEVIEFLLFGANPRGDTKPLAKALIERFGSLAGVLTASRQELETAKLRPPAIAALKIVAEASRRLARAEIEKRPLVGSWDQLLDYCRIAFGREPVERFHLLFLDRKNRLIADEAQQRGTVDHTPVYPREVVKRALELNASALILAHNHPSGDPTPSRADIAMTVEIRDAAAKLGITVHDHIIVTRNGHTSFRAQGLL